MAIVAKFMSVERNSPIQLAKAFYLKNKKSGCGRETDYQWEEKGDRQLCCPVGQGAAQKKGEKQRQTNTQGKMKNFTHQRVFSHTGGVRWVVYSVKFRVVLVRFKLSVSFFRIQSFFHVISFIKTNGRKYSVLILAKYASKLQFVPINRVFKSI